MNPLIVHLHGKRVGVLDDDGQRLVFRYGDAWLADAGALPLSRQLPLQSEPFEGQRVSVFFGGLLPEADSRDQIARNLGISPSNDFAQDGHWMLQLPARPASAEGREFLVESNGTTISIQDPLETTGRGRRPRQRRTQNHAFAKPSPVGAVMRPRWRRRGRWSG